jgi:hypothetical protein
MDELYHEMARRCTIMHRTSDAGTIWVPDRIVVIARLYESLQPAVVEPTDEEQQDDAEERIYEWDALDAINASSICSLEWGLGGAPISWSNTISLVDGGDAGWFVVYYIDGSFTTIVARLVGDHRALLNVVIEEMIANDGVPYVWHAGYEWSDTSDEALKGESASHEVLFGDSPPDEFSISDMIDLAAVSAGFAQRTARSPELWPEIARIVDVLENPGSFTLRSSDDPPRQPRDVAEHERPDLLRRYISLVTSR